MQEAGYTDAKSDLYSLGVVMYEMLTGRVPFDADTPVSVALKQVQEEPVDPITYNPDIPISVNRIILKAMQKDPNLRYQNATEMIKDLSMALKRPNEDFVVLALRDEDSPTQKIPTIYQLEMEKNNDRNAPKTSDEKETEKKKGKLAKIKEFYEKHKFVKALTILAIIGIIFIATVLIVMFSINNSRPAQAYIPQVAFEKSEEMLTEEEAIKKLKDAGFENVNVEKVSSETVEAGFVISQTPNRYSFYYNLDQEIVLQVSSGPEIVTLPSTMVGRKYEEVEKELDKIGLTKPNVVYETSETVEKGIILSVSPEGAEGEETTKSMQLSFVVSSGSQYADVEMINVVGKSESDAISSLEEKGLVVDVKYDEDTNKDDGIVLSQTVSQGTVVKEQSTVTIVVNKLPESHEVTFVIDVASYYPKTASTENAVIDENTASNNTVANTASSTPKNVTVELYIGGQSEKNVSVSTQEAGYQIVSHEYSGNLDVKVIIAGNTVYSNKVNFSQADQIITIGQ
jgi:serine/threonine-protein kinase